jgi:hypothetical protein
MSFFLLSQQKIMTVNELGRKQAQQYSNLVFSFIYGRLINNQLAAFCHKFPLYPR